MKVLISCAGTGGHIYPGIAIADKIKERHPDADILFIGTKNGMENRLVPKAGYRIQGIDASGIDRHNPIKLIRTAFDSMAGSREARQIIKEFAPDVAIGTGGYVTGPVLTQAHKLGVPYYIHEQNAVAGVANKMLEPFAQKVFISFMESAKLFRHPEKIVLTGNPIRSEFNMLDKYQCRQKLGVADDQKLVVAFGGSLGAKVLNFGIMTLIDELPAHNIQLIFITGKRFYSEVYTQYLQNAHDDCVRIMDYADNMPELMCASDLVISRAGAIAVTEILNCAKPSILVPSPNVTNNHQFFNAKALADANAAVLIEDKQILDDSTIIPRTVFDLISDDKKTAAISQAASSLAQNSAAEMICDNMGI